MHPYSYTLKSIAFDCQRCILQSIVGGGHHIREAVGASEREDNL